MESTDGETSDPIPAQVSELQAAVSLTWTAQGGLVLCQPPKLGANLVLIRYPKLIKPGSLIDEFALSIDLAPTLLDVANANSTILMDGRSLLPLLDGERPDDWRTSFLIQYNTDTVFPRIFKMGYRAIRTKRWKYVRFNELDGMDELYDLQNDPYEMQNVIDQPDARATLKRLQSELDKLVSDRRAHRGRHGSYRTRDEDGSDIAASNGWRRIAVRD